MFENFKQRNKPAKTPEVIADLDAILVEPVAFTLHGKNHTVAPISTEQSFRLANKLNEFQELMKKEGLNADTVISGYWELVQIAAPSLTRKDIEDATERQLSSLFSFIVRAYTGELFSEKKKTVTEKISVQPSKSH